MGYTLLLSGWPSADVAKAYGHDLLDRGVGFLGAACVSLDGLPKLFNANDLPPELSDLPASALRRIVIQQAQATAFWSARLPLRPGETVLAEGIGLLSSSIPDAGTPALALAYWRRVPEGELALIVPDLVLKIEGQIVSMEPTAPPPALPTRLRTTVSRRAMVSGWDVGSELANLTSLIGMAAMTANPPVGIVLMLAGQILSFIFQELGGAQQSTVSIPTIDQIRSLLSDLLQNQHVSGLAEKSAVLWEEIHKGYEKSWADKANAPSEAVYGDFILTLQQGVLATQGAEVAKANDAIGLALAGTDKEGYKTGLIYFPSYQAAACIEIFALQILALNAGIKSHFGTSSDKALVKDYRDMLDRGIARVGDLHEKGVADFQTAQNAAQARVAKISEVYSEMAPISEQTFGANTSTNYDYKVKDDGGYPETDIPSAGLVLGSYTEMDLCCSTKLFGMTATEADQASIHPCAMAETAIYNAYGVLDLKKQQAVLDAWLKALNDFTTSRKLVPNA